MTNSAHPQAYKNRIKNDMGKADAYTRRKQHKHDAEMGMISKALGYINNVVTVLDAPCGTGRATIMLTRLGYTTTGVDLGGAALTMARQKVAQAKVIAAIESADIEKLQYADKSFDATLCFRLYHHFPNDEIRERVISELCRVSNNYVLISYLSPLSLTSIKRQLRTMFFNKPSKQHATSLTSIEKLFARQEYHLVKDIPQRRFLKTLHLAIFERNK